MLITVKVLVPNFRYLKQAHSRHRRSRPSVPGLRRQIGKPRDLGETPGDRHLVGAQPARYLRLGQLIKIAKAKELLINGRQLPEPLGKANPHLYAAQLLIILTEPVLDALHAGVQRRVQRIGVEAATCARAAATSSRLRSS